MCLHLDDFKLGSRLPHLTVVNNVLGGIATAGVLCLPLGTRKLMWDSAYGRSREILSDGRLPLRQPHGDNCDPVLPVPRHPPSSGLVRYTP